MNLAVCGCEVASSESLDSVFLISYPYVSIISPDAQYAETLSISYVSDTTLMNGAWINAHAQLALRIILIQIMITISTRYGA